MTDRTNGFGITHRHEVGRGFLIQQRRFDLLAPAFLFCLAFPLFFHGLGDRPLSSSHEARAAQNGQSILLNNDWLLPQGFDRRVDLQKPPLYYWLVALAGWLDGGEVDAWSVRLPAALSALGCVLLLFWLGWRSGRSLAGFLAAAVLATFIHFTWLSRVGRIDMVLAFTMTVALVAFYQAIQQPAAGARRWLALAYVALGLGVLLKGPISLLLAGAVVVTHIWWPQAARLLRFPVTGQPPMATTWGLGLWWGLPMVLAIAGPWYWLANEATRGDLVEVFFWHHNLSRGLGGAEELAEYPWWYYGPRLVLDLLPWSPILLVAVWFYFQCRAGRIDPLARFGLVWLVAMTVLLSCFRFKRADYLVPAYPGAALFLGCLLERAWYWRRADRAASSLVWWVACFRGVANRFLLPTPPRESMAHLSAGSSASSLMWWVACFRGVANRTQSPTPPRESMAHLSAPFWTGSSSGASNCGGPGPSWTLPLLKKLAAALFFATVAACAIGWAVVIHHQSFDGPGRQAERELAQVTRGETQALVLLFRVEAHELAFHLGPPVATILEWENLDQWLRQVKPIYVIMPKSEADCCHEFLRSGQLQPVIGSAELAGDELDRPVVLLKSS